MKKSQAKRFKLPPLSVLPAFSAAARTGSLTLAATEMHLTPGAVSRQIKTLEDALGTALFHRTHNAITLTAAGRQFLTHVNGALATLETGTRAVAPERSRLVIQAPITMARRWLIPRIGSYRQEHPSEDLVIQSLALGTGETANVRITYRRGVDADDFASAFLIDRTLAVCSPRFFSRSQRELDACEVLALPILLDTADAWSWCRWCETGGISFEPKGGSIAFDTDEAAIDACISGLGIAQANPAFIERELRSGQLIALCSSISPTVGAYEIGKRGPTSAPESFSTWLSQWGQADA
ncbi:MULTISPECIES: LysR family transcriptional regulator [unclassified Ensifer]|uniref:LysR family transcriptional regulator n=1 Tax=unclassified Ensifer TaxID=2633371 RepID=UPI0008132CEF|nr:MULTISPECIES: LysR family transcriptional regulator [unclassified Ensifer]OCP02749.1 LysR family transcriptional regulator [Ensifer sp. LC14]OCP13650.1 LysR family transcriptional regulator [Ensifer sp. LC13]OCP14309.1 LysR family transcriptional regulator [Ensifer sp. LC11]OCP29012.1 LysR family transcriptional regulator [Ensifer sp. LC499]